MFQDEFKHSMEMCQAKVHAVAKDKGWWDSPRTPLEITALIHTEVAEMTEAYRHGNPQSEHIPGFSAAEEEMADIIIRVMDYAERTGARLAEAIMEKTSFNEMRPYRHGKEC